MSGYSKWTQIPRSKSIPTRQEQLFTRLARELVVAVRDGKNGDQNANFRLRMAIQRARDANMPMDDIEQTIKHAIDGSEGSALEEIIYEGYGPTGTAILVRTLTKNRNRTVAEVRNAFNRLGGSMGEKGCIDGLFESKGVIEVDLADYDPDELLQETLSMGTDEVKPVGAGDQTITMYTDPAKMETVCKVLEEKKYTVVKAEVTMVPKTRIPLSDEKAAHQTTRLIERLEDLDDVQNVYTNADFPEDFAPSYQE